MSKTSEGLEPEKYEAIPLVPTGEFRWFKKREDSTRYTLQVELQYAPFIVSQMIGKDKSKFRKWVDVPKVEE